MSASHRARRMPVIPPEINFVPLLDIISVLIQILLAHVQFGQLAQVNSTVGQAVEATGEGLQAALHVDPDGVVVFWSEGTERQREQIPCLTAGCPAPEDYDVKRIREVVYRLKQTSPKDDTIVVFPGQQVPFAAVVRAMDAVRDTGAPSFEPLFPRAILGPSP